MTRLVGFAAENFFLLIIAQLALVIAISWGINRISATVALGLFFVYAASLGLTIGLIVAGYTPWLGRDGVPVAHPRCSVRRRSTAHVTKRSLAALRGILFMGLIGILAASILNIFLASDGISWVISIVGVVHLHRR